MGLDWIEFDGMGSDAMRCGAVGLDGIGLNGMGTELRTWPRKDRVEF